MRHIALALVACVLRSSWWRALADLTSFSRGRFFGFPALMNIELEGIADPGGQLTRKCDGAGACP